MHHLPNQETSYRSALDDDGARASTKSGGTGASRGRSIADRDYDRQLRSKGWIRRYVFPGGRLPTVTVQSRTMTRVSQLQVHGLREIGQHYGPTLNEWRTRLLAGADEFEHRGYDTRLRRSCEYYLAICEAGFRSGHL